MNKYVVAQLTKEEMKEITTLEQKIGTVLIAYRKE